MIEIAVSVMIQCSNLNWEHSVECQSPPVLETMVIDPYGLSYGYLENGKYWSQERVTPTLSVFRLEDVCQLTNGYITIDCA